MASFGVGWQNNGHEAWSAEMAAAIAKLPAAMTTVVEKSTSDLVALTQRNASGRPGPNAPTGDYRGSWSAEEVDAGPGAVARSAGTNRAQALRLELGFVGADSLGRVYDQAPLPHHGPAVDVVEPVFYTAMEMAVRQVFDQ